jgi:hypothetical protein
MSAFDPHLFNLNACLGKSGAIHEGRNEVEMRRLTAVGVGPHEL